MAGEESQQPATGSRGDQIAGDKVGGDKVAGDKVAGDRVEGDKITVVVGSPEQAGAFLNPPRWSWPTAWDFRSYREEKRQGFVGRSWLFEDVRAWALDTDPQAPQALLIAADYGVGKSAFLAELLATEAAGLPVLAHHFCTSEQEATLTPALFVRTLAVQLANSLPAYRQALEAEEAKEPRQWLDAAAQDPSRAFDQAILAPLLSIEPPATAMLWVVDALDEAQEVRAGARPGAPLTIVQLLARYASRLPRWIKVLATSRRRPDVLTPLRQAFSLLELDAEEARNLEDLYSYALARCRRSPLAERLERAGLSAEEVANTLSTQQQSSGKVLYVVRVLNDLASGQLPLQSRKDLEQLPPGMDGFYQDAFERRFPSDESYAPVRDILGVLCEQREPLGRRELAAILSVSEREILEQLKPMHDLLRLVSSTELIDGDTHQTVLHGFDHISLPQWLSEADEWGYGRADRFVVDRAEAAERLRRWALAETTNKKAHTWPYLVRHLTSHLKADERPEVMAGLLGTFSWLEARLRQEGINALLEDLSLAAPSPARYQLEQALRQGAHVLSQSDGWEGQGQLASQLLARMANDDLDSQSLREQALMWLQKAGAAIPLTASLFAHRALVRTFSVGSGLTSLVALANGHLATGHGDGTIRIWDRTSGTCQAVLEGHRGWVTSLVVLGDGRLVSGSNDQTVRLWDPTTGTCLHERYQRWSNGLTDLGEGRMASCSPLWRSPGPEIKRVRVWDLGSDGEGVPLDGHHDRVNCVLALPGGRLASGSDDKSIRVWNPGSGACDGVLEGHEKPVSCLAVLPGGRLASGSGDRTIRLWDLASGACTGILNGHQSPVCALAMLPDGRLASGSSDQTIRLWDLTSGGCDMCFKGYPGWVVHLLVLGKSCLVSGLHDSVIQLWDPTAGKRDEGSEWHQGSGSALTVLHDGRLVSSSSSDHTITLWDPCTGACEAVIETQGVVSCLAVLTDGHLVSGSLDCTIQIWDRAIASCDRILEGHQSGVNCLVALPDGRLASGSGDQTIRIWNPATGDCEAILRGHQQGVDTLVIQDGCLVSGANDVRVWDPATGNCEAVFERTAWGICAAELPDGRRIFGERDHTIRVFDPRRPDDSPQVIFVADAAISALVVHPSLPLLVACDASGRLHWLELPAHPPQAEHLIARP